jgi:ribose/xylose/arabinose/galactoside ABC-type transport system permease subunit
VLRSQLSWARGLRGGSFPVLPLLALVAMIVAMGIMQPRALSYIGLQLILRFALPIIFAALAQLCVVTASDIDFGIGPFISLVNCTAATLLTSHPLLCVGLLAAGVAAYAAMGAFIQIRRLPSIVVTLGASFVWLGLALLIMPTPAGTAPDWLGAIVHWRPPFVPLPILVGVVAAILAQWFFRNSSYGVVLRGLGSAPAFLRDAGWSLIMARSTLYALAGMFGVVSGLLLTALISSGDANVGTPYTLLSVAAVIVGGSSFTGGVVAPAGAVVGAFIMLLTGVLLSFTTISSDWQLSVQGLLLLLVLGLKTLSRRQAP